MVKDLIGASEQVWKLLWLLRCKESVKWDGKQKARGQRSLACAPLSASGVGQQHSFHVHCSFTTWQVAAVLHVANGCINRGCREVTAAPEVWAVHTMSRRVQGCQLTQPLRFPRSLLNISFLLNISIFQALNVATAAVSAYFKYHPSWLRAKC